MSPKAKTKIIRKFYARWWPLSKWRLQTILNSMKFTVWENKEMMETLALVSTKRACQLCKSLTCRPGIRLCLQDCEVAKETAKFQKDEPCPGIYQEWTDLCLRIFIFSRRYSSVFRTIKLFKWTSKCPLHFKVLQLSYLRYRAVY